MAQLVDGTWCGPFARMATSVTKWDPVACVPQHSLYFDVHPPHQTHQTQFLLRALSWQSALNQTENAYYPFGWDRVSLKPAQHSGPSQALSVVSPDYYVFIINQYIFIIIILLLLYYFFNKKKIYRNFEIVAMRGSTLASSVIQFIIGSSRGGDVCIALISMRRIAAHHPTSNHTLYFYGEIEI